MFGTKAGLLVDLFLVSLTVCLPLMGWAIALARQGRIDAHRRLMAFAFALFLAAVVAFEVSIRFLDDVPPLAVVPLAVHLVFAIPCTVLWIYQVATAKRAFREGRPHRLRGRALAGLFVLTLGTGYWLYVATFV